MAWHRIGNKPLFAALIHWHIYVALGRDELRDSHYKYMTVMRESDIYNGNLYT